MLTFSIERKRARWWWKGAKWKIRTRKLRLYALVCTYYWNWNDNIMMGLSNSARSNIQRPMCRPLEFRIFSVSAVKFYSNEIKTKTSISFNSSLVSVVVLVFCWCKKWILTRRFYWKTFDMRFFCLPITSLQLNCLNHIFSLIDFTFASDFFFFNRWRNVKCILINGIESIQSAYCSTIETIGNWARSRYTSTQ